MMVSVPKIDTWEVKIRPVEFIIKEGDEHLISYSGLALIGTLMNRMELGAHVNAVTLLGYLEPKIPQGDIVQRCANLKGFISFPHPDALQPGRKRGTIYPLEQKIATPFLPLL